VIRCGLAEMQPNRPACCRDVGTKPALRDTESAGMGRQAAMHNEVSRQVTSKARVEVRVWVRVRSGRSTALGSDGQGRPLHDDGP
jgi:hypothetical protein